MLSADVDSGQDDGLGQERWVGCWDGSEMLVKVVEWLRNTGQGGGMGQGHWAG